jgi:streptogramin lyase
MNSDPRPGDPFAPEIVDERIEQLLQQQNGQTHPDAALMHELQSIYQEDADILMHARERLFQHESRTQNAPSSVRHPQYEEAYTMNSKADDSLLRKQKKRLLLHRTPLLVAGLVAVLVVGSLIAMLTLGQQHPTNAGISRYAATPTPIPRPKTMQQVSTHSNNPWGIALDETRGFVYVAEAGCDPLPPCQSASPTSIGQHSLADGQFIRAFKQPKGYSNPFFVAVNPADGHVWFTQPNSDAIGELDPVKGTWKQYSVAHSSTPYDLLIDQHGNIWFTEYNSNSIGFLDTKTHKIVETPTPTAKSKPYGITRDLKGNIWFTENGKGISRIGMFTPTTDGQISIKETIIDTAFHAQPHLITAAPNGSIWFSEGFLGAIAELAPGNNNSVKRYSVAGTCRRPPDNCTHISAIVADKQGNIWFTDSLNATIGYYIPTKKVVRLQQLHDPNSHPHDGLVVQSDGTIWFTEEFGSLMKDDPVQGPVLVMLPVGSIDDQPTRPAALPTVAPTVMPTPTPMPNRSVPTVAPTPTPISRTSGPVPTVAPTP